MSAQDQVGRLRRTQAKTPQERYQLIRALARERRRKEFMELAEDLRADEDAGEVEDPDELMDDEDFEDPVRS